MSTGGHVETYDLDQLTMPHPSALLERVQSQPERYGDMLPMILEVMQDHTCACQYCRPDLSDRPFIQQSTGHYGMRFFDRSERHQTDEELLNNFAQIWVDGRFMIVGVNEVMVGNPGTVWLYRGVRTEATREGSYVLNAGFRHRCMTCHVNALEVVPHLDHKIYKQVWSETDQKMVTVLATPKIDACYMKLSLPNVTVKLPVYARKEWYERHAREEEGNLLS
jgi:hypothetical protein